MRANRNGWAAGVVLGLGLTAAIAALSIPTATPTARAQNTTAASIPAEIHALARLEPAGGLLALGARPGARVLSLLVKEGDEVKAGQVLVVVEGHEAAQHQLAAAEAQKKKADADRARQRARLAIERGHEDRIQKVRLETLAAIQKTLSARVTQGKASLLLLEKMPGITPKDKAEFQVGLDRLEVDAARAALELEQARADQDALGPRRALEDQALAPGGPDGDLLLSQIELAKASLEQTLVKAPAAGRVLDVPIHPGEVGVGPLVLVGDLSSMVAIAEVDAVDATAIKPGAAAEVSLPGGKVAGTVTRLGRLVGKNLMANPDPRMPQDLRVVRVTIGLESPEPAARFVNLQVDATIRPRPVSPGQAR